MTETADHAERLRELSVMSGIPADWRDTMRAVLDELKQLREERAVLGALADELQVAELHDRAVRSEWHGARDAWPTDFAAHAELDRQLNESQTRLCAAQDVWTGAAHRHRTIQVAAPQQPEYDGGN